MPVMIMVWIEPSHTYMYSQVYTCSLAPIIVHVEKVIVLLCESAQQFRALLMILQ